MNPTMQELNDIMYTDDVKAIKKLIKNGYDINQEDEEGFAPLFYASSFIMIRFLLKNGANINMQNTDGKTALWSACYRGRLQLVKLLLEHGANPNVHGDIIKAPLLEAFHLNCVKMVELLLEAGADINATNENDKTILDYPMTHPMKNMLKKRGYFTKTDLTKGELENGK